MLWHARVQIQCAAEVMFTLTCRRTMGHIFPACSQHHCDKNLYWLQNRAAQSVSSQLCSLSNTWMMVVRPTLPLHYKEVTLYNKWLVKNESTNYLSWCESLEHFSTLSWKTKSFLIGAAPTVGHFLLLHTASCSVTQNGVMLNFPTQNLSSRSKFEVQKKSTNFMFD